MRLKILSDFVFRISDLRLSWRSLRIALICAMLPLGGCVSRMITVHTNPPGALVWLNDQEVGRTPFSRTFLWYGNYDVLIRKPGYQTLKTSAEVSPPVWQFIPLDLVTDLLPLRFERKLNFTLSPLPPASPAAVLARGEQLQTLLQSSTTTKPTRTFQIREKKRKPPNGATTKE